MSFPYFRASAERTSASVIGWTADPLYSFESVTVLAGDDAERTLDVGTVLGRRLFGTPTAAPAAGNTGNGTLTPDAGAPLLANAKAGAYRVTCVAVVANGGTFRVTDPDGYALGDAVVGTAFANAIRFTIADGSTDFAAGDSFTVTVPDGDGKVVMVDFAALDGTARACGVLADRVTAPDGTDAPGSALVRQGLVKESGLVWPGGATAPQKAAALRQLKAAGIIARMEA